MQCGIIVHVNTIYGGFTMKKIMIPVVALTLGLTSISPSLHASAKENNSMEKVMNVPIDENEMSSIEPDFVYEIHKNEETRINTINMTYEGKESVAIYNENSGEVVVDGELVAIINKDKKVIYENEETYSDMITPYAGTKTYTIGDPKLGSGYYTIKYMDNGTVSILGGAATMTTVAAVVVSLFSGLKSPLQKHAQIIAAASSILTVINSTNTTLNWTFMHTKDQKKKFFYSDTLNLKKGANGTTHKIKHYYGYVS